MRIKCHTIHPVTLFLLLCLLVSLISWIGELCTVQFTSPASENPIVIRSLLSAEGARWILRNITTNLSFFEPLSMTIVGMLGYGLAFHSGFFEAALPPRNEKWSRRIVVLIVILLGILSSVLGDAGYVLLLPFAAYLFRTVSLNPVAGLIVAFVAVASGFAANLFQTSSDELLAINTLEVAQGAGMDADRIGKMNNFFFMAFSVLILSALIYFITFKYLLPRLTENSVNKQLLQKRQLSLRERRALHWTLIIGTLYAFITLFYTFSPLGFFRSVSGGLTRSPFLVGNLFLISVGLGIMGLVYGFSSGRYSREIDVIEGLSSGMTVLVPFLAMAFFSAQLSAFLSYSNLSQFIIVKLGEWLSSLSVPLVWILVGVVFISALSNLFIASSCAKWTILAPILVPALGKIGIAPDAVLCAYKIGDSATNTLSPVISFLPFLLAYIYYFSKDMTFARYVRYAWPFSFSVLVVWTLLFILWMAIGLPLGD